MSRSTAATTQTTATDSSSSSSIKDASSSIMEKNEDDSLLIVFSDLDGTLIHYPSNTEDLAARDNHDDDDDEKGKNTILKLPPSSTGMRGIISSKTLAQCRDLRLKRGIKLVLVSGMRTSTLLKRLPYLPAADAYCSEVGGRIFYPTTPPPPPKGGYGDDNDAGDKHDGAGGRRLTTFTPVAFDGATASDLRPFGLREDLDWRGFMERDVAAGRDGYHGAAEIITTPFDQDAAANAVVPVRDRTGALWRYAAQLEREGLVVDTKGYSTCFRVNRKQQVTTAMKERFDTLFSLLLQQKGDDENDNEKVVDQPPLPPTELATSTNLGCIDFYPAGSGKKNCCEYLAKKFGPKDPASAGSKHGKPETTANAAAKFVLSRRSVFICDDDNDIEMALACSHAYIPALSSDTMRATIAENPSQFTTVFGPNVSETAATEEALRLILQRVVVQQQQQQRRRHED